MNQYDGSILRAIEYIENRIDHEIPLDEIARVAAFSKFHFTRIFKAVTKENLNDYIRKRRLTLAARALIETDMPIQQIGFTYGYSSQEAFTRAFKQYTGISPQSYRNKGVHYHNLYKECLLHNKNAEHCSVKMLSRNAKRHLSASQLPPIVRFVQNSTKET